MNIWILRITCPCTSLTILVNKILPFLLGAYTAGPDFVGKIDRPNPSGLFMIYIITYLVGHLEKGVDLYIYYYGSSN